MDPLIIVKKQWMHDEYSKEDGVMKKKCESCGLESGGDEGWSECRDCGKFYCPECSAKMSKEQHDIEKLREGDSFTRVQVLCPSCSLEMLR
jgi:hypothetical protein